MSSNLNPARSKNISSNTQILNDTNPEIFDTSPRPGGFLKLMVPTRSQDYMADACSCPDDTTLKSSVPAVSSYDHTSKPGDIPQKTSREFRIRKAVEETDWEDFGGDEGEAVGGISNPVQATMNMLAVSISCVMMMAAKMVVSDDYLNWTQNYLQCIKDNEGEVPPNIRGILNEITKRLTPGYTQEIGRKEGGSATKLSKSKTVSLTKTPSKRSGVSVSGASKTGSMAKGSSRKSGLSMPQGSKTASMSKSSNKKSSLSMSDASKKPDSST